MEQQNAFNRAGTGWNNRKAGWAVQTGHYDGYMVWVVTTQGRNYQLVLNCAESHFARKHLMLPGENDGVKRDQARNERAYFDAKATSRLANRRPEANDRQYEKYQIEKVGKPVTSSTVLNLKQGGTNRRIEEREAAVRIAQALGILQPGQEVDVVVDFGVPCVLIARLNQDYVKAQRTMRIMGKVSPKNNEVVLLYHASSG